MNVSIMCYEPKDLRHVRLCQYDPMIDRLFETAGHRRRRQLATSNYNGGGSRVATMGAMIAKLSLVSAARSPETA
jgi:hypothetical protein